MVYIFAVIAFLLFFLLAGIGVIFKGKAIRGSCGNITVIGPDGEPLTCSTCPNRKKKVQKYLKSCPSLEKPTVGSPSL